MSDDVSPPDWSDDKHISNGGVHYCYECFKDRKEKVELEIKNAHMLKGWSGVNWMRGFEERVVCPECESTGQIKTKSMDDHNEKTRFIKLGAASSVD